ncbi:MAG: hypothetical protein ABI834_04045 [Ginsengibacter sp.]
MLHKRYNYKSPLILTVIFFTIFLKTNTISQINTGKGYNQNAANIALLQKVSITGRLENRSMKKSVLLSIYIRFISQFL